MYDGFLEPRVHFIRVGTGVRSPYLWNVDQIMLPMDIDRKRFELELQFAAEKSMNVEQKIRLIEYLLKEIEGEISEENNPNNK